MAKKVKRNLQKEITDTIIKSLKGGVAPWVKGWSGGQGGFPMNGGSKRRYNGVNVIHLLAVAQFRGFASNEWFTFKQANTAGGRVKRGEKGTTVVFTKWNTVVKEDPETGEEKEHSYPMLIGHTVFNRDQLEGMPEPEAVEEMPEKLRHERADALVKLTGAKITYGDSRAYYRPSSDSISMPSIEQFEHESEFYSTSFHELVHWTGHRTRLDRLKYENFGSEGYSFEELVAELGAAFTCGEVGIEGKLQHAEYIGSWIKVLENDYSAIFKAASLAEKATTYLLDFETEDKGLELEDAWNAFFEWEKSRIGREVA